MSNNTDASSNTESQESKKSKHMTKEKSENAKKNQQKITKSYLEENTKNLSLLARGVSGDQATNLINKQIRSK